MASVFLSHNSADKDEARRLAAHLTLLGASVWFDEWNIRVGDSIPKEIGVGLDSTDHFVLLWSANAAKSRWVQSEMNSTITVWLSGAEKRIVPIRLDDTPMPALLADLKYVDARSKPMNDLAEAILGLDGDRARRRAIQLALEESAIDIREYYGYGSLVACPKCGADHDQLEGWSAVDHDRDDMYAGARCKACGWNDGGEV